MAFAERKRALQTELPSGGQYQWRADGEFHLFNPESIPNPDMKDHVQRGHKKGLGIFLMRQIMDEVRYKFRDGVKNELTLVKFIR